MSLPRSGPVRSEAARLTILDATARLFRERGYEHLTIEGIAALAGVGKQTIYRWWDSKGALVAECLFEGRLLPERLDIPDTGDIRRDLAEWLRLIAKTLGGDHGDDLMRSLISVAAQNAEVGARLRDSLSGAGSLTDRLRAAVGTVPNLPDDGHVEEMAEALIGAVILRALSRSAFTPAELHRLLDIVLGR